MGLKNPSRLLTHSVLQNVLDGDLMEQFNTMPASKRKEAAEEVDRTPAEMAKKLEDMRSRYAF